jgi:Tfp pilus assembly protein PilO
MEMDATFIWDVILAIFIPVAILVVRGLSSRLEKTEDLLARTREEYATKYELSTNMNNMMQAMHRLEDKLDALLKKG